MAKVKIQGHASGSGILTVTAPNTSTDRTITLPDADVTLGAATPSISDGGNATAITIDSSESVGIDNSTGFGTYSGTGVKYSKGDGTFFVGRAGGQPFIVNRETDQGDMICLNVAGSSKVKIGTVSDGLFLGTGTGGNTKAMIINSDGKITKPLQPAFFVNGSPSKTGNYVHSFGNIKHNIGSHYVNSTGRFTAPVAGRYLFTAGIWAAAGADNFMQVRINEAGDHAGVHVNNSAIVSGTVSAVYSMAANDYASIHCLYTIQGSTPRNFFSGILIG